MNKNLISVSGYAFNGKDEVGRIINSLSGGNYKIKKFADKLKDITCMLIGCTREQLEDRDFKDSILGEEWWYFVESKFYNRIPYLENKNRFIDELKIFKPTVREFLQEFGTDAARNVIHKNIWVNALMSEYNSGRRLKIMNGRGQSVDTTDKWIITDTRFPNELEAIKSRGGITIRVNRYPNKIYVSRGANNTKEIDFDSTNPMHMSHYLGDIRNKHESETALDKEEFDYVIDNNGTLEELKEKVKEILIKEGIL